MNWNNYAIANVTLGLKANFAKGQKMATTDYLGLAMVVPSTAAIEQYPQLVFHSKMREWFGPREIKNVEGRMLSVRNRKFEDTVGLKRDDVEDNQLGMYSIRAQEQGAAAENLWDDLLFEAILANSPWLDGKAFFAADRKYGETTICNTTTGALSPAAYAAARKTMMSFADAEGMTLGVNAVELWVGPANEEMAKKILEADLIIESVSQNGTAAVSNIKKGTAKVRVTSRFVGTMANMWMLVDNTKPLKPFLVQKRREPEFVAKDKLDDDNVFEREELLYGVSARGNGALAVPHLVYMGRTPS